ncbi:MAG: phospholipase/carboxylesterase [Candidatus Poriferisodalaceae bacterium]|jgi:phospholipase/carboxylesterase
MSLLVNTIGSTTEAGSQGTGGRLLVLIHGYGADENDLAPLARLYDPAGDFHVICPRGPFDVPPWGAGWYERSAAGELDEASFVRSVDLLDAAIDEACAQRDLRRSEAVVVGFSQGGAMALAVSLRAGEAEPPAAVVCMSGMLQEPAGMPYAWDRTAPPAIYVQHGTEDPMVPIERGHHTRDRLTEVGFVHRYDEYPMQHEIRPESILDLREWLAGV